MSEFLKANTMAVTNRVHWLSYVVLVITLTFSNAGGKRYLNHGALVLEESTTESTTVDSPSHSDDNPDSDDRFVKFNDKDMQQQFRFQDLPDSYKKLFMSVEDLIKQTDTFLASQPSNSSRLVFNRETHEIMKPDLEPLASRIERTLVPNTWKAVTYNQACCPSLDYLYPDNYLKNVNGVWRHLVQFPNYNPPMFQFLYHATCRLNIYGANGHCVQGFVAMSLAVFDYTYYPPIAFDLFYIPAYCKCLHY